MSVLLPVRHLRDSRSRFEAAAKAGTDGGMNHLDSLTTQEKIMTMAKLGIVSTAGNYFSTLGNPHKQRAGGLMRYTLCVFSIPRRT